jgi:Growth inhibitor
MNRGEVYDARLEPVEGSEQGGTRPFIIVSRDSHYGDRFSQTSKFKITLFRVQGMNADAQKALHKIRQLQK